ncbi:unnamed protein product [Absidia cylindrospora]
MSQNPFYTLEGDLNRRVQQLEEDLQLERHQRQALLHEVEHLRRQNVLVNNHQRLLDYHRAQEVNLHDQLHHQQNQLQQQQNQLQQQQDQIQQLHHQLQQLHQQQQDQFQQVRNLAEDDSIVRPLSTAQEQDASMTYTARTSVYATPFTSIPDDEDDQDIRIPVTLIPVDDIDYDILDDDDDVMYHVSDGEDGGNDDGDNMHLDNDEDDGDNDASDDEDDQVIPKINPRVNNLANLLKSSVMHVIRQRLLRGNVQADDWERHANIIYQQLFDATKTLCSERRNLPENDLYYELPMGLRRELIEELERNVRQNHMIQIGHAQDNWIAEYFLACYFRNRRRRNDRNARQAA